METQNMLVTTNLTNLGGGSSIIWMGRGEIHFEEEWKERKEKVLALLKAFQILISWSATKQKSKTNKQKDQQIDKQINGNKTNNYILTRYAVVIEHKEGVFNLSTEVPWAPYTPPDSPLNPFLIYGIRNNPFIIEIPEN